CSVPIQCTDKT
nr:Chain B, TRAF family member-associated NF-kappa-b activator